MLMFTWALGVVARFALHALEIVGFLAAVVSLGKGDSDAATAWAAIAIYAVVARKTRSA